MVFNKTISLFCFLTAWFEWTEINMSFLWSLVIQTHLECCCWPLEKNEKRKQANKPALETLFFLACDYHANNMMHFIVHTDGWPEAPPCVCVLQCRVNKDISSVGNITRFQCDTLAYYVKSISRCSAFIKTPNENIVKIIPTTRSWPEGGTGSKVTLPVKVLHNRKDLQPHLKK